MTWQHIALIVFAVLAAAIMLAFPILETIERRRARRRADEFSRRYLGELLGTPPHESERWTTRFGGRRGRSDG